MSKITLLQGNNFKCLRAISYRPKPGLNQIRGRNSQGKTSFMDLAMTLLLGRRVAPDEPIRAGCDRADGVMEIDNELRIRRTWGERETLTVENKDTKAKLSSPQAILDRMMKPQQQVDPLMFVRMKPKETAAIMRQIAGLDTADLDKERELVFAQRTAVNRDADALKARFEAMPEPEAVPQLLPEVDITALLGELEQASRTQARNDMLARELAGVKDKLREKLEAIEALTREVELLRDRMTKGEGIIAELPQVDIEGIKRRADEAKARNAAAAAAKQKRAEIERATDVYDAVRGQLDAAERTSAMHTDRLKEIDAERAKRLAEAKFPIKGLSVEGDMVTLNDVPVQQASSKERILLGFHVVAALVGELKVAICLDGSLLDDEAMAEVEKLCEQTGLQVFIEVVGTGPGGIVIEGGLIKEDANA